MHIGASFCSKLSEKESLPTLERIRGTAKILHTMAKRLIHIEGKSLYFFF